MSDIVILSGSPSENSRTQSVLNFMGALLEKENYNVTYLSVRDVPSEDLMFGNFNGIEVTQISSQLKNAKGVIVGSPIYKSSYSGVLKALIDILPQDILQNTPVLPVMTGGSPSHLLALEYTLKPLLATLKGKNLKGLYFTEQQIEKGSLYPIIDEDVLNRTRKQLNYFIELINNERVLQTI
nr:NADPH-dependent FMN reductase [Oceanobacillus senegalensis]